MTKKTWIIFIVVCLVIFGGLIFSSRSKKIDVSKVDGNKVLTASQDSGNIGDHTFGKTDSKVVLVEYGDFQCPYCGRAFAGIKKVTEEYKDKIAFVFRNNPLPSLHPNAKSAAAAAEAAGLQGKYWEMHDELYTKQDAWSNLGTDERTKAFVDYAKTIGVKDLDKFKTDMAAEGVNAKINYDLSLGQKAGVTGTPSFFLNGEKISDDIADSVINGDGTKFREAIDKELK